MHHKMNVTLNLLQVHFGNMLAVKTNEILNPPAGGQHDEQIDSMTQYGHSLKILQTYGFRTFQINHLIFINKGSLHSIG